MIIDFHTHVFPDAIASGTIAHLEQAANIHAFTDGTLSGLKNSMKESPVTTSVVLPVVTKPSQFESINHYAASINGKDGIISFGGIHPDSLDYRFELEQIKSLGLPGIKLHPDYQKTFIDDERYLRIIQYATELGLIISIHAGIDVGLPDPVHCPPKRTKNMLNQVLSHTKYDPKIVLAHTGGYDQWDQVEEFLVGLPVYFDISFSLPMITKEQFLRIIRTHGANRILFATDSPWSGQAETVAYVKQLGLTKEENEMIFYRNAMNLL